MTAADSIIRVDGLSKTFVGAAQRKAVLEGLEFEVFEGEFVAVVGRSGSGKTTLMHILGGIDNDYTGELRVAGCELGLLDDADLSTYRNRTVGVVFQQASLIQGLNVIDNVLLPTLFSRVREDGLVARAEHLLNVVGLAGRSGDRVAQLSGGERQRMGCARALIHRPKILLCDELTGNLDGETGGRVLEMLLGLRRDEGLTVVAATHDPAVVQAADRAMRLDRGTLSEVAP